jgi:GNAT superfamily N-acetyltransferase
MRPALATLDLAHDDHPLVLRHATADDLPTIVRLLAADSIGVSREADPDGDLAPYRAALDVIDADPAHLLVVAEHRGGVVGTLQLSFIPGLSRRGMLRSQIEGVRVDGDRRGLGLGGAMIEWCVDESRRRGCGLVQLTTDKSRADAHRFYRRLGFVASHEGFKRPLDALPSA